MHQHVQVQIRALCHLRLKTSGCITTVLTMTTNKTIVEMSVYICACASLSVIHICMYISWHRIAN